MESTRLQREQSKGPAVVGDRQKSGANVNWRRPLTLNDHSPAQRLGRPFELSDPSMPFPLQAKLNLGTPGDQYEQEADRVAEQVMRMPDPAIRLQRKCACDASSSGPCEQCGATMIQRRATAVDTSSSAAAPAVVHNTLRSPGQALDSPTRAFFEARFKQNFSHVRVHTDKQAAISAQQISARAYTVGRDIVFGSGEYAPTTMMGQQLLAHELAHIVQQSGLPLRRVQRQTIHMESGRFVGQIGGTVNNVREEVLGVIDRLAHIGSMPQPDYLAEWPAVNALAAGSIVPTTTIPLTIAAITRNDTPTLAPSDVGQLGFTISTSVGQGGPNVKADILTLQDVLHVNWHITNADYATERPVVTGSTTANIPEASIPKTVAGITKLKRAYVGGIHTDRFRRQLGVLGTALRSVGDLNWVPMETGVAVADPTRLQSDFARWALVPGAPQPNSVSGRVNCWEMILLSAFRAGFLTHARIQQIYSRAVDNVRQRRARLVGDTVESELKTGRQENTLVLGDVNSPQPRAGDMVIFNTAANHAAISLGTLNGAGEHEVLSLFNRPNAISQVQRTTIEALIAANPGQTSTPIRFWGVSW